MNVSQEPPSFYYVASTVVGLGDTGANRTDTICPFMKLMGCVCVCVCVRTGLHIVYKQNKTCSKHFKIGWLHTKVQISGSVWKHQKIWEEVRSLSTGQPAPPKPSQVPKHSSSLPPETGSLVSLIKRVERSQATQDEGPRGTWETRKLRTQTWRTRTEMQGGKGGLASTLCPWVYLSLGSACFVWLDTENPGGEFWFQLALCTANYLGLPEGWREQWLPQQLQLD